MERSGSGNPNNARFEKLFDEVRALYGKGGRANWYETLRVSPQLKPGDRRIAIRQARHVSEETRTLGEQALQRPEVMLYDELTTVRFPVRTKDDPPPDGYANVMRALAWGSGEGIPYRFFAGAYEAILQDNGLAPQTVTPQAAQSKRGQITAKDPWNLQAWAAQLLRVAVNSWDAEPDSAGDAFVGAVEAYRTFFSKAKVEDAYAFRYLPEDMRTRCRDAWDGFIDSFPIMLETMLVRYTESGNAKAAGMCTVMLGLVVDPGGTKGKSAKDKDAGQSAYAGAMKAARDSAAKGIAQAQTIAQALAIYEGCPAEAIREEADADALKAALLLQMTAEAERKTNADTQLLLACMQLIHPARYSGKGDVVMQQQVRTFYQKLRNVFIETLNPAIEQSNRNEPVHLDGVLVIADMLSEVPADIPMREETSQALGGLLMGLMNVAINHINQSEPVAVPVEQMMDIIDRVPKDFPMREAMRMRIMPIYAVHSYQALGSNITKFSMTKLGKDVATRYQVLALCDGYAGSISTTINLIINTLLPLHKLDAMMAFLDQFPADTVIADEPGIASTVGRMKEMVALSASITTGVGTQTAGGTATAGGGQTGGVRKTGGTGVGSGSGGTRRKKRSKKRRTRRTRTGEVVRTPLYGIAFPGNRLVVLAQLLLLLLLAVTGVLVGFVGSLSVWAQLLVLAAAGTVVLCALPQLIFPDKYLSRVFGLQVLAIYPLVAWHIHIRLLGAANVMPGDMRMGLLLMVFLAALWGISIRRMFARTDKWHVVPKHKDFFILAVAVISFLIVGMTVHTALELVLPQTLATAWRVIVEFILIYSMGRLYINALSR